MTSQQSHNQVHPNSRQNFDELQNREPDDLFQKLIVNLTQNQNLQNQSIKDQFKLHLIKDEDDLHNYKNLLNAMAALFYTNHKMNDV